MDKSLKPYSNESFEPFYDAFIKVVQENIKATNRAMNDWAKQLIAANREQMEKIYTKLGFLIQELLENAELDAREVAPHLLQANLWLSPSMDMVLLRKLKEVIEHNDMTSDLIVTIFVEHYEADNWAKLNKMVFSWEENPFFVNRMHIIHDALEAHVRAKYTLVIPTLLSQVEGVASSILEKPAGETTGLVKSAVKESQGGFLQSASNDILIKFITSPVGYGRIGKKESEYFTPERYTEWLKLRGIPETQSLNRHAILHGVHVNYANKVNSLRVFLLLDVLYWMRREEWDRGLQLILRRARNRNNK